MNSLQKAPAIGRILIGSISAVIFATQPALHSAVFLSSGNGTYTQTFDTLATSGSANVWTDDTTITGWYAAKSVAPAAVTSYRSEAGTGTTGALYSYGTGTNTDRALGSLASGTPGNFAFGVLIQNSSGSSLTLDTFSFFGEQWRNGGNTTAQTLTFAYQISASPITSFDASAATPAGWTPLSVFNFTSPIATATAASLDGNATTNRAQKSGTLGLTLQAGQYIALRWFDLNDTGNDHGLSIDDLSLAYSAAVSALYWDSNGAAPGIGGTGNWDTATANWSNSATGDTAPTTFNTASPITFGGAAGNVTIATGGITSSGGIQLDTAGYTIGGGTLTLAGGSLTTAHATGTTIINSAVAGSAGLQKNGPGILRLGATNTFSGSVTLNAGTLAVSADSNLGTTTNAVQLGGGRLQTTASMTLDAARSVTGSGSVEVGTGTTLTIPGTLNTTALTVEGTGTLALTGTAPTASTLTLAGAATVTSTNAIVSTALNSTNTTGTATITGAIDFGTTSRTIAVADGSAAIDLALTGGITLGGATNRITKIGDGTLAISGTNVHAGLRIGIAAATPSNGGTVIISDADDLGANQLQFNAGTLNVQGGAVTTPVGVSIGAGQLSGGATFTGSPITFQGTSSIFKATGTTIAHRITANSNVTFSGGLNVSGGSGISSGLTIAGSGTVILPASANTISENITVDGGNLEISGALTGATVPTITTTNLGILSGISTGAAGVGAVTATTNGLIAPGTIGDAAGLLVVGGNLDIQSGAALDVDIGGTSPDAYDRLSVTGSVTLGGGLFVSLFGGYTPAGTDSLTIILNDGGDPVSGTFDGLPQGSAVGSTGFFINYAGGDGNDVVLTTVPEPGSAVMLLSGLALLGTRRRRHS